MNPGRDQQELNKQAQADLEKLRKVLVSPAQADIVEALKAQQRELVTDVIAESLNDREQKDGTIQKVLQPIVNKSVEKSVSAQKNEFVDYLYPVVGSLVRRAVSAFVSDFIEKTNQLIENSFSFQGLKWRYRAWRSGISFSRYVASQTFVFQVHQVFLIHAQTGMLLQSVQINEAEAQDADLISAMLIAINDFVSDSFTNETDNQHLGVVKTDDFTLILKSGPQALVVAAVTGNISPEADRKLQVAMEDIHKLFATQLRSFEGDATPFEAARPTLSECLLFEEKEEAKKNKLPIWGLLITLLILGTIFVYSFAWWDTHNTANNIRNKAKTPGLVLTSVEVNGVYDIDISILKDKSALGVDTWLAEDLYDYIEVDINPFISASPELLVIKIAEFANEFPNLNYAKDSNSFSGKIDRASYQSLVNRLQSLPGYEENQPDYSQLEIEELSIDLSDSKAVLEQTFTQLIGKISQQQLIFEPGIDSIGESQLPQAQAVAQYFSKIDQIATKLNRSVSLIIVGASDTSGDSSYNLRLSQNRAENIKQILIDFNINSDNLFAVGIGEVNLTGDIKATRKVLFNVIFTDLAQQNGI
jgi:outer membrane protein OmpA-like peptidoglycan-associated protein/predicted transcriptional regulator